MSACVEIEPLLAYRPLEVMNDDEAVLVEGHLLECTGCRERLQSLEQAYEPLLQAQTPDEPEGLWDGVLARLEEPRAPEALGEPQAADLEIHVHCAFCHDDLVRAQSVYCASCLAPHHDDCFTTHGRCSAPGCEETHSVRPTLATPPVRPLPRLGGWVRAASVLLCAGVLLLSGVLGVLNLGPLSPEASGGKAPGAATTPPSGSLNATHGGSASTSTSPASDPVLADPDFSTGGATASATREVGVPRVADPNGLRRRYGPSNRVLSGTILMVEVETAIISLGLSDGVREEDEFTVWREAELLGRVTVKRIGAETTEVVVTENRGIGPDDAVLLANESMFAGAVLGEPLRVYYLEGPARWEFRFLSQLLVAEPEVALQSYLTQADPTWTQRTSAGLTPLVAPLETLGANYEAVIAGVTSASALPTDLLQFVERGGGLILLAGEGGLNRALRELSPVHDAPLDPSQAPQPVALVADHPAVATLHELIDGRVLPDLYGARPGTAVADGQQALALLKDGRPLISIREHGAGRIVYVGTDDLWRWRSVPGLYRGMWRDLISWASGRTSHVGQVALEVRGPTLGDLVGREGRVVRVNGTRYRFIGIDPSQGDLKLTVLSPDGRPLETITLPASQIEALEFTPQDRAPDEPEPRPASPDAEDGELPPITKKDLEQAVMFLRRGERVEVNGRIYRFLGPDEMGLLQLENLDGETLRMRLSDIRQLKRLR